MKFSNQFHLRQNPLWSEFYLDYENLKGLIKSCFKRKESESREEKKDSNSDQNFVKVKKTYQELSDLFFEIIEKEITKVESWYIKVEAQCHKYVQDLEFRYSSSDSYELQDQISVAQFSEKLISLKDFSSQNFIGFVKILKKYKKHVAQDDRLVIISSKISESYFKTSKGLDGLEAKIHPIILYGGHKKKPNLSDKKVLVPPEPVFIENLDIKTLERGKMYSFWVPMTNDPFGLPITVPVMIARGVKKGPILGIVSGLHGNEINGIPLIQRLFADLDVNTIVGTIVAIPIANPPGYVLNQRQFNDGVDLNRLFPGRKNGTCSSQFVYHFFNKIIKQLEYLIDLHTASSGRVNSLYVRADMNDPISSRLAYLQNPQIVCHQPKQDKSVRGAAAGIGIKSIAVEIGNPYIFQKRFIKHALLGVTHIMSFLKMIPYDIESPEIVPTLCSSHSWVHTDVGGLLTVYPQINTWVKKGETFAIVHDIFGNVIKEYKATKTSIVVGKATSPVNQTGDRMILLGVVEKEFVKEAEKRIIGAGE